MSVSVSVSVSVRVRVRVIVRVACPIGASNPSFAPACQGGGGIPHLADLEDEEAHAPGRIQQRLHKEVVISVGSR